jgi:tetratricopeptide (TPR) repeat protein
VEPIEVLAERALGGGPALGRAEAGMAARRLALSGHDDAARAALKLADEGVEKHIAMLRLDGRKEDVAWLARQATEKPSEWLAWVPQAAWDDPTLARTLKNVVEAAILSSDPATASDMLSTLGDRTRGPESRLYTTMAAALLVAAQTGDPFHDRGFWLDLAELHRRAGSLDEALEYLDRGVQAFPNEFTFHYARGRLLQDLGRHEEALQSAEAALANSYGDSLLRAAMLCARLLDQVGREDEALRLLDAIEEKATRPGPELKVRTHRYLEELRRTREELRKPR